MAPKFVKSETFDDYVTEKVDIVNHGLLGDYNKNGIYIISDKIANELIALKKVKKESFKNSIYCLGKISEASAYSFEIMFKKNSSTNLAVAELFVLETIPKQGGRLVNIKKTPIGKFTEEISSTFVEHALVKFNVDVITEGAKEYGVVNAEYINSRKILLENLDKLSSDDYNQIYEEFFTQRMTMLKGLNNDYTNKVLEVYNEEFNMISDFFLKDKKNKKVKDYKSMNELLDKALEDVSGLEQYKNQEKELTEKMLPVLGMFIAGAEKVEKVSQDHVLDQIAPKNKELVEESLKQKIDTSKKIEQPRVAELNPNMKEEATKSEAVADQPSKAEIAKSKFKNIEKSLGALNKEQPKTIKVNEDSSEHHSLLDDLADHIKQEKEKSKAEAQEAKNQRAKETALFRDKNKENSLTPPNNENQVVPIERDMIIDIKNVKANVNKENATINASENIKEEVGGNTQLSQDEVIAKIKAEVAAGKK